MHIDWTLLADELKRKIISPIDVGWIDFDEANDFDATKVAIVVIIS
jgi:hypothetical protein